MLCGSGYEWRKCVNGVIPFGAVPLALKLSEPLFIARSSLHRNIGIAYMNGTAKASTSEYYDAEENDDEKCDEFEILVAKNVKHRECTQ